MIQEDRSPVYDEYADADWYDMEAALHLLCQDLQEARVVISPPPKPPDPTERSGYPKGSYEHYSYEGEVHAGYTNDCTSKGGGI